MFSTQLLQSLSQIRYCSDHFVDQSELRLKTVDDGSQFRDVTHALTDTYITKGVGAEPVTRDTSFDEITEGAADKHADENRQWNIHGLHRCSGVTLAASWSSFQKWRIVSSTRFISTDHSINQSINHHMFLAKGCLRVSTDRMLSGQSLVECQFACGRESPCFSSASCSTFFITQTVCMYNSECHYATAQQVDT